MKKKYIIPETHTVTVNLFSSVLDNGGYDTWSHGAAGGDEPGFGDAKGHDGLVNDDEGMSYNNFKDLDIEMNKDYKRGLE